MATSPITSAPIDQLNLPSPTRPGPARAAVSHITNDRLSASPPSDGLTGPGSLHGFAHEEQVVDASAAFSGAIRVAPGVVGVGEGGAAVGASAGSIALGALGAAAVVAPGAGVAYLAAHYGPNQRNLSHPEPSAGFAPHPIAAIGGSTSLFPNAQGLSAPASVGVGIAAGASAGIGALEYSRTTAEMVSDGTISASDVRSFRCQLRSPQETENARKSFDSNLRKNWLKKVASNPANSPILKAHGITDAQIDQMKVGIKPIGWDVHHIQPLKCGGSNDDKNFVLVRNTRRNGQQQSDHQILNEAQRGELRGLNGASSGTIELPAPPPGTVIWGLR